LTLNDETAQATLLEEVATAAGSHGVTIGEYNTIFNKMDTDKTTAQQEWLARQDIPELVR
jgi:photosystem II stability/assembly factor-like uncharacterized protein